MEEEEIRRQIAKDLRDDLSIVLHHIRRDFGIRNNNVEFLLDRLQAIADGSAPLAPVYNVGPYTGTPEVQ